MGVTKFISREEAQRLVASGFTKKLADAARATQEYELERWTEKGYQWAMKNYGLERREVNPDCVEKEYVEYHTHGGRPRGTNELGMAITIEAYAAGELVVKNKCDDTGETPFIPLTQSDMEAGKYTYGPVWNPQKQGEPIRSDAVCYGYIEDLRRSGIVEAMQECRMFSYQNLMLPRGASPTCQKKKCKGYGYDE